MRLKTMNKRINQSRFELDMVVCEFELKLRTYLRSNIKHKCYADVYPDKVVVKSDDVLSDDELDTIKNEFFLELENYEELYSPPRHLVCISYNFRHKKLLLTLRSYQ